MFVHNFILTRNPSIDGDKPFKSCGSPNVIFCQEVANEPKTHAMNGIKELLHYFAWRDIEKVVLHKNDTTGSKADRPSHGFLLNTCIILYIGMYIFSNRR